MGVGFGVLSESPAHIGRDEKSELFVDNNTSKGGGEKDPDPCGHSLLIPWWIWESLPILGKPLW